MRDGDIWKCVLKLRVFTPWMLIKELNVPAYMKPYVKEKVRAFLISQTKNGVLKLLHDNPPVFGLPGESVEKITRVCPICGTRFIPVEERDTYCSTKCEKEYRKRYLERKRRQAGMKERRRYTEQEEQLIWETLTTHGCKSAILQELAEKLKRTPEAIKSKFKKMRRYSHDGKANSQVD